MWETGRDLARQENVLKSLSSALLNNNTIIVIKKICGWLS